MALIVSALFSAAYFLTMPWHPFPGSFVIKAASIAILSVIAARNGAMALALALALSAIGDALLEYSPGLFAAGLLAFLLAQVTYTLTFLRIRQTRWFQPALVFVGVYSLGLAAWLLPAVSRSLAVPVAIYVAAITVMAMAAFTTHAPNRWMEMGAVLFLISDSVLAVNRFRMPVPLSGWVVWSTYYIAQLLITLGYSKAREASAGASPITPATALHATHPPS